MVNYLQLGAIILAGISVGIADALIKKSALSGGFASAFSNPWMILVLLLYLFQVVFFVYVFINGWKLGIVGNLQMVFYSISVLVIGLIVFGEKITFVQGVGIALALIGVVLMNFKI